MLQGNYRLKLKIITMTNIFQTFVFFFRESTLLADDTRKSNICRARVNITDLFTVTEKGLHGASGFDL